MPWHFDGLGRLNLPPAIDSSFLTGIGGQHPTLLVVLFSRASVVYNGLDYLKRDKRVAKWRTTKEESCKDGSKMHLLRRTEAALPKLWGKYYSNAFYCHRGLRWCDLSATQACLWGDEGFPRSEREMRWKLNQSIGKKKKKCASGNMQ